MLVLTTLDQKQLVPRVNSNKPEIRHFNILNALQSKSNANIIYPPNCLTIEILKDLNVHSPHMIDYLAKCYQSFITSPDNGYDYINNGVTPYTFLQGCKSKINLTQLDYWKQAGLFCKDTMTPIFEHTWETALSSANNSYCVKDYITPNEKQLIYCLNLYPGHHTGYDTYGGYCFLNNGAVCVKSLLQNNLIHKIGILDLDYHAGDGTYNIFKENSAISTVSIHADPLLDYPFYDGYSEEDILCNNKNITFGPNTDIDKYLLLLDDALRFLNESDIDVLIIAFGGDTYKNDPDASTSCRCLLDILDYKMIGEKIRSQYDTKPIIVTQEGGYEMNDIDKVVLSFLEGL